MMCLDPDFGWGHNLSFFGLRPWAILHGMDKLVYLSNMTLITPFERSLSKRLENQKIV